MFLFLFCLIKADTLLSHLLSGFLIEIQKEPGTVPLPHSSAPVQNKHTPTISFSFQHSGVLILQKEKPLPFSCHYYAGLLWPVRVLSPGLVISVIFEDIKKRSKTFFLLLRVINLWLKIRSTRNPTIL